MGNSLKNKINYIRELYWKIFGWPDIPPKYLLDKKALYSRITKKLRKGMYPSIVTYYINGLAIEDIAILHNITRERVRQCLWKCYRESKEKGI